MIKFNLPHMTGKELSYVADAHANGHLSGDGTYTKQCNRWLEENAEVAGALLTHSCTAALELAALLADISPGDEVIMPSFTFVSTANAFVLRGAKPVFVDIRPDTLNIDERLIESAISDKTKAIVPVHYAGVSCEMDTIMEIADRHRLFVIEDAAQGVKSDYKGRPLGSIGHFGAYSFHETKNIQSGEGGALLLRDAQFIERAEIIREKGTNRSQFFRGQADKYTWCDIGSSYLPSELISAFLFAQMEEAVTITQKRLRLWERYHFAFQDIENREKILRPFVPTECKHNAHLYYLLLPDNTTRTNYIEFMLANSMMPVFHYVPLHSSPMGLRVSKVCGDMSNTDDLSQRLVRLPLYVDLDDAEQDRIIGATLEFFAD